MIIICWLIFCVVIGVMAKKRGRNSLVFALLSAVISPIGGLIVLLIMGEKAPSEQTTYKISASDKKAEASSFVSNYDSDRASRSFCSNCGAQIDADTRFCPKCGKQINA